MPRKVQNCKKKGSAFQRAVAKLLEDSTGEVWKSVAASGALRWGGTHWTWGDILPPEGYYICIECKHHANISIDPLIFKDSLERSDTRQFLDFWAQAVGDAERASKALEKNVTPVLVFKKNYGRPIAVLREADFSSAHEKAGSPQVSPTAALAIGDYRLVLVDAAVLFSAISPQHLF